MAANPSKFTNPMEKAAGIHEGNGKGVMSGSRRTAGAGTPTAVTQDMEMFVTHPQGMAAPQPPPGRNWFLPAALQDLQGKFRKPRHPEV